MASKGVLLNVLPVTATKEIAGQIFSDILSTFYTLLTEAAAAFAH